MRMIFVNIPVKDLEATKTFFATVLGFTFNPDFSDDTTACMVVEQNIFYMLMVEERFKTFINGDIADPFKGTQALHALTAESKQEIDETVAKAIAAGGKAWKPVMDLGFMYGGSFQDINGHVWELSWMDPAALPPH